MNNYQLTIKSTGNITEADASVTASGEIEAVKQIYSQNAEVFWSEGHKWNVFVKHQLIAVVEVN